MLLLPVQCFEAVNGTKFDSITLYKPAGWKPSQADAEKYYASLSVVPHPPGEKTLHGTTLCKAVAWLLQWQLHSWPAESLSVMSMAFQPILGGRKGWMHEIAWVQLVTVHGVGGALHIQAPVHSLAGCSSHVQCLDRSLFAMYVHAGVNITAELGPTITWLQENVANLTTWALANKNKLEDLAFALVTYFEDSSVNGKLMNAVPGSQLYTMVSLMSVMVHCHFESKVVGHVHVAVAI